MAHARAKLTVLGRQLLVDRVVVDGWKPHDAAKAMGASRQTAYKWLRRFREEGRCGLEDRSSAPRRCPHRLGDNEVAQIVATRLTTLHGPHRLAYALGRPRSTVYGVLRREGVNRLSFIDRPTRTVVRYERGRPGELLHVDVKKLGRIRDGGGWKMLGRDAIKRGNHFNTVPVGFDYLHVAVDDHSRVAFVRSLPDEKGPTCAQFIQDAATFFEEHGVRIERARQRPQLPDLQGLSGHAAHPRNRPPAHRELPTPDQRESGAVQSHPARGIRLQDAVHIERRTISGPRPLGRLLQCAKTSYRHQGHDPAPTSRQQR